jgi:hypothetical protein
MSDRQHHFRVGERRDWKFFQDFDAIPDRKLRLLACACCRRAWKWLGLMEQRAVILAELYADGRADDDERQSLADEAWFGWSHAYGRSTYTILGLLSDRLGVRDCLDLCHTVLAVRGPQDREEIESALREEILGPTWLHPAGIEPAVLSWHGGVVVELARCIHEEERYGWLPILADALEEAGCTEEGILDHCRSRERAHVRGCWVIDRVLGRG